MRDTQLEALAKDILESLRDMNEDEPIFTCPDIVKCRGCEINPDAITQVVGCLEWAIEQEEARREFSY